MDIYVHKIWIKIAYKKKHYMTKNFVIMEINKYLELIKSVTISIYQKLELKFVQIIVIMEYNLSILVQVHKNINVLIHANHI